MFTITPLTSSSDSLLQPDPSLRNLSCIFAQQEVVVVQPEGDSCVSVCEHEVGCVDLPREGRYHLQRSLPVEASTGNLLLAEEVSEIVLHVLPSELRGADISHVVNPLSAVADQQLVALFDA